MKIILSVLAFIIILIGLLGFFFIRWANRPENVAALQKQRQDEAAKKIEDEKKQVELNKENEAKKANLKLAIDEKFADNRFDFLEVQKNYSFYKFEQNQFTYAVSVYKGSSPQQFFIFSKEDFGDFAAEMNFDIWGRDATAGIFWDAQPNGDQNPPAYQVAYSTPNGLYVEAGEAEDYDLGSFLESATTQKLRVERFGTTLKVSVNDKVLYEKTAEKIGMGKVGIYLGHRGGREDSTESISVYIKNFKVWK